MSTKTFLPVNVAKRTADEFRPGPIGHPHLMQKLTEDNHSLFRAICYALNRSDDDHNVVRLRCCEELEYHPSLYDELIARTGTEFAEYVQAMKGVAKGTETEMLAAANAWFVAVHLYVGDQWRTYMPSAGKPAAGFYLYATGSGHYMPVVCVTQTQGSNCYGLCNLSALSRKVKCAQGCISDVSRRTKFYDRQPTDGSGAHDDWIKVYAKWREFLVWLGDKWWGDTAPMKITQHVMTQNQVVISEPLERAFGAVCSVTYRDQNKLKMYSVFVLDGMYACKELRGLRDSPEDIVTLLHDPSLLATAPKKDLLSYFTRANVPDQMAPYKTKRTVTIQDRATDKHVCTLTLSEPLSGGFTPGRVFDVVYNSGIDPRGRKLSGFSIVFGFKGFAVVCMRSRTMLSQCQHADLREVLEKFYKHIHLQFAT